ncbi:MAG: cytochrome c oxidase subunit 3 [Marmoricola sp.]|jgi:nitric oxide reductase NorE protein
MSQRELAPFLGGGLAAAPASTRALQRNMVEGVPAEPGLWVFLFGDMAIFGAFFVVFLWERRQDPSEFAHSAAHLYQPIGVVNTLVLLVSSYLVVLALEAHRRNQRERARTLLNAALCFAFAFASLKAVEYSLELSAGHTPGSNRFFTFYYVLTGVHLLHVILGAFLLFLWRRRTNRASEWATHRGLVEAAAVYWHMVDLLWVVIFSLLYLVCA